MLDLAIKKIATEELIKRNKMICGSKMRMKFPFIIIAIPEKPKSKLLVKKNLKQTRMEIKVNTFMRILGDVDTLVSLGLHKISNGSSLPEKVLELCHLID